MKNIVKQVYFADKDSLHKWLEENHTKEKSIWLVHDKFKNSKLSYNEIVEEALCFGWIDSTLKKLDENRNMIYFSRRNPKSIWAKSNKERVERLIKEHRMKPAGLAVIERAKNDGSWSEFDAVENLIVPPELKKALAQNKLAQINFENFSPSVRKQILYFIYSAKQEETKNKRTEKVVKALEENKNPFI